MRRIGLVLFVASCGCVSLTPAGERVEITYDRAEVAGCEKIGRLHASGPNTNAILWGPNLGSSPSTSDIESRDNDLRNQAALQHANKALIVNTSGDSRMVTAEIYRCPAAPSTAATADPKQTAQ